MKKPEVKAKKPKATKPAGKPKGVVAFSGGGGTTNPTQPGKPPKVDG